MNVIMVSQFETQFHKRACMEVEKLFIVKLQVGLHRIYRES